ncbi:hypothetical protein Fmac_007663 [Flemingia macrophylla]|uniref:Uncharacterized protein n=1 Tax=Flemingia macrophylla TaxID=520843 RepID=A0ABD1MW98_9FABA
MEVLGRKKLIGEQRRPKSNVVEHLSEIDESQRRENVGVSNLNFFPIEERTIVGTVSANGERDIGELIARAMEKVGKE